MEIRRGIPEKTAAEFGLTEEELALQVAMYEEILEDLQRGR